MKEVEYTHRSEKVRLTESMVQNTDCGKIALVTVMDYRCLVA
jgi:hypothetical protein